MDIPDNPHRRDFRAEVDAAVAAVLKEMGDKPGHRTGSLSVNHGCSHFHVMMDVADAVAARFKEKGYHAHYCCSIKGTAYALEITTYPTDHEI